MVHYAEIFPFSCIIFYCFVLFGMFLDMEGRLLSLIFRLSNTRYFRSDALLSDNL